MAKGPIFMLIKINTLDGGNSVKKVEKELIFTMKTSGLFFSNVNKK